jgi:hypothetical protein
MIAVNAVCEFVYSFIYRAAVMGKAAFVCRCGMVWAMNVAAGDE